MAGGIVFIEKRGTAWSLQLKSTGDATSSLDCEPGWKNRRGDIGRGTRIGAGLVGPDTEKILDMFLELDAVSYVSIVEQDFLEFSFDRPIQPNDAVEVAIVRIIKGLLKWDLVSVENPYSYSEPQAYVVQRYHD